MSAAPAAVAKGATIVTMDDKGMHTLRKGTNAFTCMPDNPATPGPDPMCADKNAMEWVDAWVGHKPPPARQGRAHVHAGGRHRRQQYRSVRDQARGRQSLDQDRRRTSWSSAAMRRSTIRIRRVADPDTTQPYVMWAGTPYQHLMAPVR